MTQELVIDSFAGGGGASTELFRAQGFADSYVIDRGADGLAVTKTDQIRLCGNSVCPQVAAALVAANYVPLEIGDRGIPAFALQAAE